MTSSMPISGSVPASSASSASSITNRDEQGVTVRRDEALGAGRVRVADAAYAFGRLDLLAQVRDGLPDLLVLDVAAVRDDDHRLADGVPIREPFDEQIESLDRVRLARDVFLRRQG